MATNPPMPPMPGAPPPKKSNAVVWILGGLGGCLVLIFIIVGVFGFFIAHKAKQAGIDPDLIKKNPGMAAAKMMVAANPDVETVSTDEGRGEITVRNKKDGKVFTISFEDAKNGKFTMRQQGGEQSSLTFGGKAKFPAWVPDYPGSDPQGAFAATGTDGATGTFSFKTKDPAEKVQKYYEDQLKGAGMKITNNMTGQSAGSSGSMLTAQDESNKHTVTVIVGTEGSETTVAVTYQAGK